MKRKAVFLDRDGVLNKIVIRKGKLSAPVTMDEFILLPKISEAILYLQLHDFLPIVVTNQPEVGRGLLKKKELAKMHDVLRRKAGISVFYYCPHTPEQGCLCLKPMPGMIDRAVEEHGINLAESFVVGDRWRDIELARIARCRSVLVRSLATKLDGKKLKADFFTDSLWKAVKWIISKDSGA